MESARTSKSAYKRKVSSGADAGLFFIVLGVGATGIFLLKRSGYEQLVVTAWPCILLVLYAAAVWRVPRFQLREDQAGDNCYYLGFLFTLFSLALALAAFVRTGGTEEIVEDFGIALASTIIGLALRVAFNQMRQDPVEIEREARLELATAAQRLRSELDQSVLEMNAFSRATRQSIVDSLEELVGKVNERLEENLARYDRLTSGTAERVNKALEALAENAERLKSVAEGTTNAVETLTERISAVKVPEDLVVAKLAPVTDAVAEMVAELRQRAGAESREFRQLRKMIEDATTATAGLGEHVEGIAEALKGVRQLGETLDAAARRLGALTMGLDEAGKALVASSEVRRQALIAEAESVRGAVREAHAAAAVGKELRHALGEPAREAGAALAAIAGLADGLRQIETELRRLPEVIEEQISALSRLRVESAGTRSLFGFRTPR